MGKISIKYIFAYFILIEVLFGSTVEQYSFQNDIQPILDKRCVVCHSCYNSPCQLKLSSFEGLQRGATKEKIYSSRVNPAKPTRLFIDANTKKGWEELGFYSVVKNIHGENLMMELLRQKQKKPQIIGEYDPESDELTCSKDKKELNKYLEKNPYHGMPYGFPALETKEHDMLMQWLKRDIKDDKKDSVKATKELKEFEKFLNNKNLKHQVVARYIYEHLFLAHIKFSGSDDFYKLIRLNTKTKQPIKTRVPYGKPKGEFSYRFQKITSTIVHKTHMVYTIDEEKLKRYKNLFIDSPWDKAPYMPSYERQVASNPLEAFEQIPLRSRYLFLLDNVEYFIRTFIRGPVCKGQIALNVINDHFWIAFKDPEFDYTILDKDFLPNNLESLATPNEYGSDAKIVDLFDIYKYNNETIKYYQNKNKLYAQYGNRLDYKSIWKGNRFQKNNNDAILTIYRHFDSASVHNGALGDIPKTMWVIDYPLLERLYYSLVAGFDVFGNTQHKVMVRKYMDRLRIEGESNFLEYLPKEKREKVFNSWYKGTFTRSLVSYTPSSNNAPLKYNYSGFVKNLLEYTQIKKDPINYTQELSKKGKKSVELYTKHDIEQGLKNIVHNDKVDSFKNFSSDNFNLVYIRFKLSDKKDIVYTMLINRWHDNVAFMFNEVLRLDKQKDTVNFIEGFIGSYPNYFVVVEQQDIKDFFYLLEEPVNEKKLSKYFISRSNKDFWKVYDWFQQRFYNEQPLESGLFDLNRYYKKSF